MPADTYYSVNKYNSCAEATGRDIHNDIRSHSIRMDI